MKRVITCLLAAVMVLGAVPATTAAFSDIPDPELAQQLHLLEALGIFAGMPDGTFRPDAILDRASFCVLAVKLTAPGTDPSNFTGYAHFPDVRAGHWFLGWVNAARSLSLISGYPDGTFSPSDPITFAQAVTVLMRALNYKDEQVGTNWPTSYINKAASIGMTKGLSHGPNDSVTRADAARMIYNLLFLNKYDETASVTFISSLGVTEVPDSIVLSLNATLSDGSTPAIRTSTGLYAYSSLPSGIAPAQKGTLLLDKDNKILSFAPATQNLVTAILSDITNINIKDINSKTYAIGKTIPVYASNSATPEEYDDVWASLRPGETLSLAYNASNVLEYVFRNSVDGVQGAIAVISEKVEQGVNPLVRAFGSKAANAVIYKNNVICSVSDLCRWDVLSYDSSTNTVLASDYKLTGVYEAGQPNSVTPTKITTFGETYDLTADASAKMASYSLGSQLTYLFASDRRTIADVLPTATVRSGTLFLASPADLETGVSSMALPSGKAMSTGASRAPAYSGKLVRVTYASGANLIATPISYTAPSGELNFTKGTVGTDAISPYCKYYEAPDSAGIVRELQSIDILPNVIPRAKILHAGKDGTGKITCIVFRPITYDCYFFGTIGYGTLTRSHTVEADDGTSHTITSTLSCIEVDGASFIHNMVEETHANQIAAISGTLSASNDTILKDLIVCNRYTKITRYAINNNVMTIGSMSVPIATDVIIKNRGTGASLTLAQLLEMPGEFTVYTDPGDCRVRYVEVG